MEQDKATVLTWQTYLALNTVSTPIGSECVSEFDFAYPCDVIFHRLYQLTDINTANLQAISKTLSLLYFHPWRRFL